MKAWRFTDTHIALSAQDVADPVVRSGTVKVSVRAAGLCHSDIGILEEEKWRSLIPNTPITPGHEVAGDIVEIADDVDGFAVGDRVAVWPFPDFLGYHADGGFGETVVVSTSSLLRIPDGVSYAHAAIATDAGMSSHGAIMTRGALQAGERVGIIGLGGLGQIGARLVVLNGAELYVAETKREIWPLAAQLGARRVVASIDELTDVEFDLIVDFAGFGSTTRSAIEAIRPGGRVVLVGLGILEATIDTYALIIKAVDLRGHVGGTAEDIASVLDWIAKGEITPMIEEITWDQIPEGLKRLEAGGVQGRLVCIYD